MSIRSRFAIIFQNVLPVLVILTGIIFFVSLCLFVYHYKGNGNNDYLLQILSGFGILEHGLYGFYSGSKLYSVGSWYAVPYSPGVSVLAYLFYAAGIHTTVGFLIVNVLLLILVILCMFVLMNHGIQTKDAYQKGLGVVLVCSSTAIVWHFTEMGSEYFMHVALLFGVYALVKSVRGSKKWYLIAVLAVCVAVGFRAAGLFFAAGVALGFFLITHNGTRYRLHHSALLFVLPASLYATWALISAVLLNPAVHITQQTDIPMRSAVPIAYIVEAITSAAGTAAYSVVPQAGWLQVNMAFLMDAAGVLMFLLVTLLSIVVYFSAHRFHLARQDDDYIVLCISTAFVYILGLSSSSYIFAHTWKDAIKYEGAYLPYFTIALYLLIMKTKAARGAVVLFAIAVLTRIAVDYYHMEQKVDYYSSLIQAWSSAAQAGALQPVIYTSGVMQGRMLFYQMMIEEYQAAKKIRPMELKFAQSVKQVTSQPYVLMYSIYDSNASKQIDTSDWVTVRRPFFYMAYPADISVSQ